VVGAEVLLSEFTPVVESGIPFSSVELDTGVDFTSIFELGAIFGETELDTGVDFVSMGDAGVIVILGTGFGEDGFGEGPFGGMASFMLSAPETEWTPIDTP